MKLTYRLGCLVLVLGCGPDKRADPPATSDGTAISSTTAPGAPLTGTATSTAALSTTDDPTSTTTSSSSSSTGEPPPPPLPDKSFCPLDWSAPSPISGMTPLGPFSGEVAWFEWQLCHGYYPTLIVVEDAKSIEDALTNGLKIDRGLAIMLPIPGWEHTAVTGEVKPRVFTIVDGEFSNNNGTEGTATIITSVSLADTEMPAGIPHITGTFSLHSENMPWDISGSFDAAYCGRYNGLVHMNC